MLTEQQIGIILSIIPILFAISLHEAAHGFAADKLGDATARMLGRLTANPLKHIDPIGTVIVPIIFVIFIGFPFGWAKPVPVDVRNFKNPPKDMALVAIAGPMANLVMMFFWAFLVAISVYFLPRSEFVLYLIQMADVGVVINLILMTLNLLPIPPLDGGRVVSGVLPRHLAYSYDRIEPYGMWIIIFLLATGILGKILWPMVQTIQQTLYTILGLG